MPWTLTLGAGPVPLGDPKPQLHAPPQEVYLIQQEVHVLPADLRADHHLPEEVGPPPVGLVAQHEAPLLHHPLLDGRGHLHGRGGRRERPEHQVSRLRRTQALAAHGTATGVEATHTQRGRH